MSAVYETIEGLLLLAVLMLPVLGLFMLLAAAHLLGGALRSQGRSAHDDGARRSANLSIETRVPIGKPEKEASTTNAA